MARKVIWSYEATEDLDALAEYIARILHFTPQRSPGRFWMQAALWTSLLKEGASFQSLANPLSVNSSSETIALFTV